MSHDLASQRSSDFTPARIEYLRVENYRALRNVELKGITPLTVLLGPNGSGKTTLFDVFSFLSECFQSGLRPAWDRRGRAHELKTRGQEGPVVIEIKYREAPRSRLMSYHLAVDEDGGKVVVAEEWLAWTRGREPVARSDSWTTNGGREPPSAAKIQKSAESGWILRSVPQTSSQ